jgi:hypothetical protein
MTYYALHLSWFSAGTSNRTFAIISASTINGSLFNKIRTLFKTWNVDTICVIVHRTTSYTAGIIPLLQCIILHTSYSTGTSTTLRSLQRIKLLDQGCIHLDSISTTTTMASNPSKSTSDAHSQELTLLVQDMVDQMVCWPPFSSLPRLYCSTSSLRA